jgi:hypothetical protein
VQNSVRDFFALMKLFHNSPCCQHVVLFIHNPHPLPTHTYIYAQEVCGNQAKEVAVKELYGTLLPGASADFILLNDELDVLRVFIQANQVWP